MAKKPAVKRKRCRNTHCKKLFVPFSSLQIACNGSCALAVAKTKEGQKHTEKAMRKETRERRAKVKSKADHLREAQTAFNAFIRKRDELLPCVSCERTEAKWDAGHYRSVGAARHLRFNEDNCHKQCARPCNQDLSGNILEYRIRLVKRIGQDRVDALENNNDIVRLTIKEVVEIKRRYKEKLKEL